MKRGPKPKAFCKHGHPRTHENVFKNGNCKLCAKERSQTEAYKRYMREHRQTEEFKHHKREYKQTEVYKQYMREYLQTEAYRQYRREYKQTEAYKQYMREYRQSEKGRLSIVNASARRRGAVGEVSGEEWRAICAVTNDCCACCGLDRQTLWAMKRVLTADHIVPIVAGGTNTADNVQPLCHSRSLGSRAGCNNVKHDKTINYLENWKPSQSIRLTPTRNEEHVAV